MPGDQSAAAGSGAAVAGACNQCPVLTARLHEYEVCPCVCAIAIRRVLLSSWSRRSYQAALDQSRSALDGLQRQARETAGAAAALAEQQAEQSRLREQLAAQEAEAQALARRLSEAEQEQQRAQQTEAAQRQALHNAGKQVRPSMLCSVAIS